MNRLHDERDEEEEIYPDVLFGEDEPQDEEFDGPCKECGDEDDVRLVDSRTVTGDEPDPKLPLCGTCRTAHEAFYDAAEDDVEEPDDTDEVDPTKLD